MIISGFLSVKYLVIAVTFKIFALFLLCLQIHNYLYNLISVKPLLEYDYVIVGSGTAGSLISYRIATETAYTFAVLEAGGFGNALLDIPALSPLLHGSHFDWQYETVTQGNACLSMKNQKCKWPMGKIVGGSARLNNMIHVRGNLKQYVNWFNNTYSHNYIKKQFEQLEQKWLPTSDLKFKSLLSDGVLNAARQLGFNVGNLNDDVPFGFMAPQVNQKQGARSNTPHNLANIMYKNIFPSMLVEKLLIDDNKNVKGVMYNHFGQKYEVKARKGVILAAGVMGSPKILMLSGIGVKKDLEQLGIKAIVDLPVGKNLQDHVSTGLDLVLFNHSLKFVVTDLLNPLNAYDYFMNGKGPWTTPGCEGVALVNLGLNNDTHKLADIAFMVLPVGLTFDMGIQSRYLFPIDQKLWESYFMKNINKHSTTILPILAHPKSRGYVKLNSLNVYDQILIHPNYYSEREDVGTMIKGIQLLKDLVKTKAMKELGAYMNTDPIPGCNDKEFDSIPYWECYIRHITLTTFHPVGTCKMGPLNNQLSVVGTDFKVKGFNNLYVVDGSVIPTIPSGNINAAVALMANIFIDNEILSRINAVCDIVDIFFVNSRIMCYR